jgi:hypothetical protein
MTPVACPSCGEKGSLPDHLIGKKIRCQKCGKSFSAGATSVEPAKPAPADGTIDVDGLDPSTWTATAAEAPAHPEPLPAFVASPPSGEIPVGSGKQYKVLTQRDRWFAGQFELAKLEDALNHYARQGWTVRAMSTPHVTGFSGGPREEIVILLER